METAELFTLLRHSVFVNRTLFPETKAQVDEFIDDLEKLAADHPQF